MKTYKFALAFAALVSAAFAGCQPKQEKAESFNISTESFHWADSVPDGNMVSTVDIRVTAPDESSADYAAATKWIAARLGVDAAQANAPMQKLMQEVGSAHVDSIKENLARLHAAGYDEIMPSEYSWRIAPVYFTDQYVTYTDTAYAYEGGAHGITLFDAATFTLADGKHWGYDMFNPQKLDDLRLMVINALATQYFGVDNVDEMAPRLLESVESVTLPSCPPYLTADGVAFTYQQYEIAPYSEGMPSCVLSFFDVHNFLTPDFAKYISE
ncbi:MAG: RsiV family protein [Clostridium sp.]|nr:RsiV family protein [Clostridium sp.]